jgi:hypothetical protein
MKCTAGGMTDNLIQLFKIIPFNLGTRDLSSVFYLMPLSGATHPGRIF